MDYYRLTQAAGIVLLGLGIGVLWGTDSPHAGKMMVGGLVLIVIGRLLPWLRRRE